MVAGDPALVFGALKAHANSASEKLLDPTAQFDSRSHRQADFLEVSVRAQKKITRKKLLALKNVVILDQTHLPKERSSMRG